MAAERILECGTQSPSCALAMWLGWAVWTCSPRLEFTGRGVSAARVHIFQSARSPILREPWNLLGKSNKEIRARSQCEMIYRMPRVALPCLQAATRRHSWDDWQTDKWAGAVRGLVCFTAQLEMYASHPVCTLLLCPAIYFWYGRHLSKLHSKHWFKC